MGLRRLAGACLLLTGLAGLPLAGTLIGASKALNTGNVAMGVLAGCALVLWQGQETLRRAMMSQGDFKGILPGDVISYTGQAIAVFVLATMHALTINRAFAVMGLTSLLAMVVQSIQIGIRLPRFGEMPQIMRDFWQMGRWVLIGSLTAVITTLSLSWTMAYFHGVDGVGQFQAMAGVLKLSNPLMLALAGLIVPAAARALREGGLKMAEQVAFKYAINAAAVIAPYYLGLILMPSLALRFFYGANSPLADLTNELRVFVLSYSVLFIAQVIGCFLNGIEQSKKAFVAQVAQTAATVVVTLPLTALYGLPGMLVGWLSSNVVLAASYVCILRRIERPDPMEEMITVEMRQSSSIEA
jgi:O-antigen/teichoic acid export membrane protein